MVTQSSWSCDCPAAKNKAWKNISEVERFSMFLPGRFLNSENFKYVHKRNARENNDTILPVVEMIEIAVGA